MYIWEAEVLRAIAPGEWVWQIGRHIKTDPPSSHPLLFFSFLCRFSLVFSFYYLVDELLFGLLLTDPCIFMAAYLQYHSISRQIPSPLSSLLFFCICIRICFCICRFGRFVFSRLVGISRQIPSPLSPTPLLFLSLSLFFPFQHFLFGNSTSVFVVFY